MVSTHHSPNVITPAFGCCGREQPFQPGIAEIETRACETFTNVMEARTTDHGPHTEIHESYCFPGSQKMSLKSDGALPQSHQKDFYLLIAVSSHSIRYTHLIQNPIMPLRQRPREQELICANLPTARQVSGIPAYSCDLWGVFKKNPRAKRRMLIWIFKFSECVVCCPSRPWSGSNTQNPVSLNS